MVKMPSFAPYTGMRLTVLACIVPLQARNMHLAAEKGKHLRLRPFLSGNVDALDESGLTPLFLASSNGHLRCVTMLLDAKADVNALSKSKTALMTAAEFGHLDVVNTLIEARADLSTVTTAESVTRSILHVKPLAMSL
jgi:hypothetical protein